jgi:hypothetical protein
MAWELDLPVTTKSSESVGPLMTARQALLIKKVSLVRLSRPSVSYGIGRPFAGFNKNWKRINPLLP